jgi:multimeric flavodoxin WrbA
MRALVLNCTLKPSPDTSNTEALARVVMEALEKDGIETEILRVVDHDVKPDVSTDEGNGDELPSIHDKVLGAEILIIAAPT